MENHLRSQSATPTGFAQFVYYTDSACTKISTKAVIYAVGVCVDFYLVGNTIKSLKITAVGSILTLVSYSDTGCVTPSSQTVPTDTPACVVDSPSGGYLQMKYTAGTTNPYAAPALTNPAILR